MGNFVASADRIGILSEQLVFSQLLHSAWACEKSIQLSTFRTRGGAEVDFVVDLEGDRFGVEVKNSGDVYADELEGLRLLSKVSKKKVQKRWVLHMGSQERKFGDIHILPW